MTILVGGSMAILSMLGFVLAVGNIGAVVSGENTDPIGAVLNGVLPFLPS